MHTIVTSAAIFTNGTYFMDTPCNRQVDDNEDDDEGLVIRGQQCLILLLSQYCIKGN
jgi:hypothetical protein